MAPLFFLMRATIDRSHYRLLPHAQPLYGRCRNRHVGLADLYFRSGGQEGQTKCGNSTLRHYAGRPGFDARADLAKNATLR
jgi:hypothetical protein